MSEIIGQSHQEDIWSNYIFLVDMTRTQTQKKLIKIKILNYNNKDNQVYDATKEKKSRTRKNNNKVDQGIV